MTSQRVPSPLEPACFCSPSKNRTEASGIAESQNLHGGSGMWNSAIEALINNNN